MSRDPYDDDPPPIKYPIYSLKTKKEPKHLFPLDPERFKIESNDNSRGNQLYLGDLKTKILQDFIEKLRVLQTEDDVKTFTRLFKKTTKYKLLGTRRGLFSTCTRFPTSSAMAIDNRAKKRISQIRDEAQNRISKQEQESRTKIFSDFKKKLSSANSEADVRKIEQQFKKSGEYKSLGLRQGLLARTLGFQTADVSSVNQLIQDRIAEIEMLQLSSRCKS